MSTTHWTLWTVGVYLIGFVVAGRAGYRWAGRRERTYLTGSGHQVPRTDDHDRAAAFFIALFWPVVATVLGTFVGGRQVLRWSIWAPTPVQRFESRAAELADIIRTGLMTTALANALDPALLARAQELATPEQPGPGSSEDWERAKS